VSCSTPIAVEVAHVRVAVTTIESEIASVFSDFANISVAKVSPQLASI
jgi:hypothetical protein